MLSLLLCLMARAADPQPTVILPSAAPVSRRTGEAAAGVAGVLLADNGSISGDVGVQLQGVWGVTDHIALTGTVLASPLSLSVWTGMGLRYAVLDRPEIHVSPFAIGMARLRLKGEGSATLYALGIAVEGGWERVRLDASIPLVGGFTGSSAQAGPTGLPSPLLLSTIEAGVNVALPNGVDALRLGCLSILPALTWRHEGERWQIETTVASLGTASAVSVRAGMRL